MNIKKKILGIILLACAGAAIAAVPVLLQPQVKQDDAVYSIGSTYYSAQLFQPPLPYNPFPDLPLYSFEDGKFVYDDTKVDYVQLHAEAAAKQQTEIMAQAEMSEDAGTLTPKGAGSGGGMAMAMGGELQVAISRNGSGFDLDVINLQAGTFYGVLTKTDLIEDPFANPWNISTTFTATGPTESFTGLFGTRRFFAAANLDAYTGPSIRIVSPLPGPL